MSMSWTRHPYYHQVLNKRYNPLFYQDRNRWRNPQLFKKTAVYFKGRVDKQLTALFQFSLTCSAAEESFTGQ
jgi:hypothetical protein